MSISPEVPEPPVAAIVSDRPRSRTIPLEWPVTFGARTYSEIVVRRMTARDLGAYMDALAEAEAEATSAPAARAVSLPMFYDEAGERVPFEVLDALDADDDEEVAAAIRDFSPRAFRQFLAGARIPATGDASEPTSGA